MNTYDETKGKFSTYYYIVAYRECMQHWYYLHRDRRMYENTHTVYIEDIISKSICDGDFLEILIDKNINIERQIENKILVENIKDFVDSCLTEKDQYYFYEYYIKEKTYTQIGTQVGISKQRVAQIVQRLRRKIRARFPSLIS